MAGEVDEGAVVDDEPVGVLADDRRSRIAETPRSRLSELLPWNWMSDCRSRAAA
jgi:hypothetical protein